MEFRPLAKSVYLPKRNFGKFPPKPENRGIIWGGRKRKPCRYTHIYNRVLSLSTHVCKAEGIKQFRRNPEKKGQKFLFSNE